MNDSSPCFHANLGETPLPSGSRLSRRFWTTPFWRALPGGMWRRWWMFRPLDLIARHWPVFKKPRGVLVVRMDGIGDMVLFRRTLDRYAEVFGVDKSEITVLGCASWANLADVVLRAIRFTPSTNTLLPGGLFTGSRYPFGSAAWRRRSRFAIPICAGR